MSGRQRECATSGVCLALAFAEQLASFGDVHGLLFGVLTRASCCSRARPALGFVAGRAAAQADVLPPWIFHASLRRWKRKRRAP